MSHVVIERVRSFDGLHIKTAVFQAIDLSGFQCNKKVNRVLIKPNLCYYWDHSTGETTSPQVVSAVIDYVRDRIEHNAEIKIVESDASAMRVDYAFRMLGYQRLAEEKKVELENISKGEIIKKKVNVGKHRIELAFSRILFETDLLINVPKLKVGPYASGKAPHITCALKNFYGLIAVPNKVAYHPILSQVIVAVNKLIKPDIVVVDGIVGKGRYPVKLGIVLCGTDNLSVDVVVSKIMNYNPNTIEHIRLANDEGLGHIKNVTTIGENPNNLANIFPKVNRTLSNLLWRLELLSIRMYCKLTGDTIPPILD